MMTNRDIGKDTAIGLAIVLFLAGMFSRNIWIIWAGLGALWFVRYHIMSTDEPKAKIVWGTLWAVGLIAGLVLYAN